MRIRVIGTGLQYRLPIQVDSDVEGVRAGVRVRAGVSTRCQGSGQPGSGGRGFDGPRRCTSGSAPAMAYSTMTGSDGPVREFVHASMVQPNTRQSYGAMPGVNTGCRAARFRLRVLIQMLRTCRKPVSIPHLLAYASTSIPGSLVAKAISFSPGRGSFSSSS